MKPVAPGVEVVRGWREAGESQRTAYLVPNPKETMAAPRSHTPDPTGTDGGRVLDRRAASLIDDDAIDLRESDWGSWGEGDQDAREGAPERTRDGDQLDREVEPRVEQRPVLVDDPLVDLQQLCLLVGRIPYNAGLLDASECFGHRLWLGDGSGVEAVQELIARLGQQPSALSEEFWVVLIPP